MTWNVGQGQGGDDLDSYLIACSPCGGPIAMIRDQKKIHVADITSASFGRPELRFFSASGTLLSAIPWLDKGSICSMGWCEDVLVVVCEYGGIFVHELDGNCVNTLSLGQQACDDGIIGVQFWSYGFVAMTSIFQFISVTDIHAPEPRITAMFSSGLSAFPSCWTIIPPDFSLSRTVEILVSSGASTFLLDKVSLVDQQLHQGPFSNMCLSPNGHFLALFTHDGRVWVTSLDFEQSLAEFTTGTTAIPRQFVWCGMDSVVVGWNDQVLVVGPFGDSVQFLYSGSPFHLVSECDGARIITRTSTEFLHRVPQCVVDVFQIGSTAPGALLKDAYEHLLSGSIRADEILRDLAHDLLAAVEACYEAAVHELESFTQKQLLKAATFGRAYLHSFDPENFVQMCQICRILNQVRKPDVGIPLTFRQYLDLGQTRFLKRLCHLNQHLLARRISQYLDIKSDAIVEDWVSRRVKNFNGLSEVDLTEEIMGRVSECMSFVKMSTYAFDAGFLELSLKLLHREPFTARQVPLLLEMGQEDRALETAISSHNVDLINAVFRHCCLKFNPGDFFRFLRGKQAAILYFESCPLYIESGLVQDFLYSEDMKPELAFIRLRDSIRQSDSKESHIETLKSVSKLFAQQKGKAHFEHQALEEQIKLLNAQILFDRDFAVAAPTSAFKDGVQEISPVSYQGLSVSETLVQLLLSGNLAKAKSLRSDFKVPDSRFWQLRYQVFLRQGDWVGLGSFVKATPRFGLHRVVEGLLELGDRHALSSARQYVDAMRKTGHAQAKSYTDLLDSAISEALSSGPSVI